MITKSVNISEVISGIKIASKLDWSKLRQAFENSDWMGLGVLTLEDACEIAKPLVPQANAIESVIKMLAAIGGDMPKSPTQKISFSDIIQSIMVAEGIDWKSFELAIMGHNPFVASSLVLEDIIKLISPFVPVPAAAVPILTGLIWLGQIGKPMDPEVMSVLEKIKNGDQLNDFEQKIYQQYIGE